MTWFGKRPALSSEILEELGYYDDNPELRPKPKRKKWFVRRHTFAEVAQFFVDADPTYPMMCARFDIKENTVRRTLKHPDFIKALRTLGFTDSIRLRRKGGSGRKKGSYPGVIKQHKQIYRDALELYCQLLAVGARRRDIIRTLRCVHKSIKEYTIRRWVWKWEKEQSKGA